MELDNPELHSFSSLGKPENKSLVGLDLQKIFHISASEDINFSVSFFSMFRSFPTLIWDTTTNQSHINSCEPITDNL